MKRMTMALATAIALLGRSNAAYGGEKVADANESDVAHCTFLQDVDGRSVFGERLQAQGVAKAKEDARGEAAKAGATHIVWGKPQSSDVTTITGKAYRCGG